MCWSDLNDHYAFKLLYMLAFAARRMVYAYALVEYRLDGCTQVKYLSMVAVSVSKV